MGAQSQWVPKQVGRSEEIDSGRRKMDCRWKRMRRRSRKSFQLQKRRKDPLIGKTWTSISSRLFLSFDRPTDRPSVVASAAPAVVGSFLHPPISFFALFGVNSKKNYSSWSVPNEIFTTPFSSPAFLIRFPSISFEMD